MSRVKQHRTPWLWRTHREDVLQSVFLRAKEVADALAIARRHAQCVHISTWQWQAAVTVRASASNAGYEGQSGDAQGGFLTPCRLPGLVLLLQLSRLYYAGARPG